MKIAFILFDRMTALDFVGFYDAVTRLKTMGFNEELSWTLCGMKDEISDDRGITVKIQEVAPDLSQYDLLFVPGGFGTRELLHDSEFIEWLKTGSNATYKVSVCTGSILFGAAGFLDGKKATTHPNEYDLLRSYCSEVIEDRIVKDGYVITGGGVATSVDLGLFICELLAGREAVLRIQKQMDYPYYKVRQYNLD
ncbi:DJ-1/PfpI family protein [Aeribacillus pallidus]|jgi:cyclohexyl-isocyanide hydratase|uniref:Thiamine biosynthesis protein ThiJ n=1 Tax=Aeribacillus pallidus TaxID=33936 RepID=A0A161ZUM4_9BACI|nr:MULTISPECIES: DJ-1/PfpI family protein [Aeribacillus]KZN96957.1 thiamine biosynthesis protein ThiJ [Aeribacillus pallidus]MDR9796606.1 DJ-1/PfpI family protein [Aeribacillus pallidus]MED0717451.1 DJ-1/PfpI family protein [Aeribacillus composti]MED0747458.1 DJ-1/PfpI family protein [Aeribacillus composti]MED1441126.1 DJ-1/PfpI family protein [Aeribacillus composti]